MIDSIIVPKEFDFVTGNVIVKKSRIVGSDLKKGTIVAISEVGSPPFLCSVKWENSDAVDIVWTNNIITWEEYLFDHDKINNN